MGVEKQNFKNGGGHVNGFLHLFDWKAKSQKKLFSNKSDLPDHSEQKKRNDGNVPMTRLHLMDQDDSLAESSMKGSSDYSCASSVTDEEVGGSKAPGVVAKLMGLDSLPASNFSEACSTPFFDSQSIRDDRYLKKNPDFHLDHQIMHSGNLHNKTEEYVNNNIEPKPQKVSRPIEKFQTEILPPKSAKSIPITHHKLLSPIKSAGFVSSKNVVHIMEAAAKIIESGHQVTTKPKVPLVGSSVPLKVKDLKEKVEAAKKPSKLAEASRKQAESLAAAKHTKEQSLNKSWNGSLHTRSFKIFSESEDWSAGLKKKGKSISLAVQAKANVQKREGLNPLNGSTNTIGQKEQSDVMSNQFFKSQMSTLKNQPSTLKSQSSTHKSQPSTHRSSYKKPSPNNAPNVLKQNNRQQNCLAESGKVPSKSVPSTNSRGRKVLYGDSSLVRQRNSGKNSGNTKVGSRKLGFEVNDDGKEVPNSSATFVTRKKRCIDGDINFEKNQFSDIDSKGNGMDVVSFTFTAPMARSVPAPETSREVTKKNNSFCANFQDENMVFNSGGTNGSRASSVYCNLIGGEALSTPISILEPSAFTESCNSSDTADTNSTEGGKHPSSVLALDIFDVRSSKKFHFVEVDTELSDSASSSNSRTAAGKHVSCDGFSGIN